MPCNHRFINDLYPDYPLKYLFVGTFNPSWDNEGNNNANWFYGRSRNHFWYIMPQVFCMPNMSEHKENRNLLLNWCNQHSIGITDLIQCINDADQNNPQHVARIAGFLDAELEGFNQITPTDILSIVERNKDTLCGVYLTRYEHTLPQGGPIHTLWTTVKTRCQELNIHTHGLVTPSGGYFVMTREQKIEAWRASINLKCDKSFKSASSVINGSKS